MPSARPASRKNPKPGLIHVPFAIRLDGAREVALAGDFNRWSPARLAKKPDGYFAVDLVLAPGEYQYRLVVDGEWRDPAGASRFVSNPFGSRNGILEVPATKS